MPPAISRSSSLDPRELAAVAYLADMPMVLIVWAASTIGKLSDFVGQARDRPGGLNYASTGVGTPSHLVMENLKLAAGVDDRDALRHAHRLGFGHAGLQELHGSIDRQLE